MAVSTPIVAQYDVEALRRDQFPVTERSVYLNHASISTVPRRTAEALVAAVGRVADPVDAFPWFMNQMQSFPATIAGLINAAHPHEIATVPSTSYGVNMVAHALPWQPGDNLILADCEFPSNNYPWRRAAELRGVEVRLLPAHNLGLTADMVAAAMDSRTRLVTASSVQFLSGHRTDVAAIGALCQANGTIFAVDAIQSAAHIPIDVQAQNIHILASGGQKSLMGMMGCGFLYVQQALAEQMQPVFMNSGTTRDAMWWLKNDMTPADSAQRFGGGAPNVMGMMAINESVALLRDLGIAHIDAYTTALADYARDQLLARGYEVLTPAESHGPICTFRAAPSDEATTALHEALMARRITTAKHWDAARTAYLRISFHCYNTVEEIDQFMDALKELSS